MRKVLSAVGVWLLGAVLAVGAAWGQDVKRDDAGTGDIIKIQANNSKAQMNPFVGRLYQFKNVKSGDMLPLFRAAVRSEGGTVETQASQNALLVTCPPHMLPFFDKLVKDLDVAGVYRSTGKRRFIYECRHRDARTLETILDNAGGGITGNIQAVSHHSEAETNRLYVTCTPANEKSFNDTIDQIDIPIPQIEILVKIVEVDTHDGGKLGIDWDAWKYAISGGWTWGHGQSRVRNSGSGNFRNDTKGIGFANNFDNGVNATYFGDAYHTSSGYASANGYAALLSIDASVLSQMLNYTVQKGDGKILTEAKVTVRNAQQGLIDAMTRIPFYGYSAATSDSHREAYAQAGDAGVRGYPTDVNVPRFVKSGSNTSALTNADGTPGPGTAGTHYMELAIAEEGVRLVVTPTIGTESAVVNVALTINSMVGWTPLQTPIIHTRAMSTVVSVVDGKLISMGGLSKKTVTNDVNKIPLLGSIPYMGYLFKTEKHVKKESVIFAFLRPTIKNLDAGNPGANTEETALLRQVKENTATRDSVWGYDDFEWCRICR